MTERNENKTYKVDWDKRLYPVIRRMTADELDYEGEGHSVAQSREEIISHFKTVILHARAEIQRARYRPKWDIDQGKYRD